MKFPIVLAYDQQSDKIVRCALILDRKDDVIVKCIESEQYDPNDTSTNRSFRYAWWRYSHKDIERTKEYFELDSQHMLTLMHDVAKEHFSIFQGESK